jgi:hypothetical protein
MTDWSFGFGAFQRRARVVVYKNEEEKERTRFSSTSSKW